MTIFYMAFPLDVMCYNRAQHDRMNGAASEKEALNTVQPQKEAPAGQCQSHVPWLGSVGVRESPLLAINPK